MATDDKNIVKVAVQMKGQRNIFMAFDLSKPLHCHIAELLKEWKLTPMDGQPDSSAPLAPESLYGLKFSDRQPEIYVNESNKLEITNGTVLRMEASAKELAKLLIHRLSADNAKSAENFADFIKRTSCLRGDGTFVREFVSCGGVTALLDCVQQEWFSIGGSTAQSRLAATLQLLIDLGEHGCTFWHLLQRPFIGKLIASVNSGASLAANDSLPMEADSGAVPLYAGFQLDMSTLKRSVNNALAQEQLQRRNMRRLALKNSLVLLENVVLHCDEFVVLVENELPLPNLVQHVQSPDVSVRVSALALINALFSRCDHLKQSSMASSLCSNSYRSILLACTAEADAARESSAELAHQLHVLQTLQLNTLQVRWRSPADLADSDFHSRLLQLRRLAFSPGEEPAASSATLSHELQQLGFSSAPELELSASPPGLLPLDCLLYMARSSSELFVRLVLESSCRSGHQCPLIQVASRLAAVLCHVLRIGLPPCEHSTVYHPMLFTHERPFEECFSVCMNVLSKTWKEMRATCEDLDKVMSVVSEQVSRAMAGRHKPETFGRGDSGSHSLSDTNTAVEDERDHPFFGHFDPPHTFDAFRQRLNELSYSEISNIRQLEQQIREEWEYQARPVLELREQLKPQMLELVSMQRLNFLNTGTRFCRYSSRGQRIKEKYWYIRLSYNKKLLHHGDCSEKDRPSIDELPNKLPVSDIKALLTGKDCPHMKDSKSKKSTYQLAFSLVLESDDSGTLDVVAPDTITYDYWVDGINTLLGITPSSREAAEDMEKLLSMEVKLHLLEIGGLQIQEEPPALPPHPTDFNFCTD